MGSDLVVKRLLRHLSQIAELGKRQQTVKGESLSPSAQNLERFVAPVDYLGTGPPRIARRWDSPGFAFPSRSVDALALRNQEEFNVWSFSESTAITF